MFLYGGWETKEQNHHTYDAGGWLASLYARVPRDGTLKTTRHIILQMVRFPDYYYRRDIVISFSLLLYFIFLPLTGGKRSGLISDDRYSQKK